MPLGGRTSNNTNKLKIFSLETEVEAIDIYGYENIDPEITYDFYGEPKTYRRYQEVQQEKSQSRT